MPGKTEHQNFKQTNSLNISMPFFTISTYKNVTENEQNNLTFYTFTLQQITNP